MAAGLTLAFGASCHSHDDGTADGGNPGTNEGLVFSPLLSALHEGQLADITATSPDGTPAEITSWELILNNGGSLVELPATNAVRFISGDAGAYILDAGNGTGVIDSLDINVLPPGTSLTVTEVIGGTDSDLVTARMAVSGEDLFIADVIGVGAAQAFARANRAGDRSVEIILPFKILGMAAAPGGSVTVTQAATTLADALVRFDRDLNEVTSFAAPDIGTALWSDRIAMTDDGETLVATDINGGSILRLDVDGNPAGGTLQDSLLTLSVSFTDLVDMTADSHGGVYACTAEAIGRTRLEDGTVDTDLWAPATQDAIRGMDCDDKGILHVILQDADGGQCGSIRRFDWLGGQIRRLTSYNDPDGTRFAARKVLSPQDIAAYPEGSWRMYDDTVTLDPAVQSAAWIVAGNVPIEGN